MDGQLAEDSGKEINEVLSKMFTPRPNVPKDEKKPLDTVERSSIKHLVQVSQKLFFNQRIPSYTGIIDNFHYANYHNFVLILGIRGSDYDKRVGVLAKTIRSYVYGNEDENLKFYYHIGDDSTTEKIFILHKTNSGNKTQFCDEC